MVGVCKKKTLCDKHAGGNETRQSINFNMGVN